MRSPRYAAVVLAAGRSSRAGTVNKLLLPYRGTTLLGAVLTTVRRSGVDEIIVVTGYQANRVAPLARRVLHGTAKSWRIVHAPHYARGLSTSLKAGIGAVPANTRGALVCLGDMPLVRPQAIDALIAAHGHGHVATLPARGAKWGNPVLLDRVLFPKVMRLTGDRGARPLLARTTGRIRTVPITDSAIETDIDTLADLARIS